MRGARFHVLAMAATVLGVGAILIACDLAGCGDDQMAQLKQQVAQQEQQLQQNRQQLAALQAQVRTASSAPAAPSTPAVGTPNQCDRAIVQDATRRGGERLAAGESAKALGYYQDAVTACPGDAQAQLNLAHAYEANSDTAQAVSHYRLALRDAHGGEAAIATQARAALKRLGAGG